MSTRYPGIARVCFHLNIAFVLLWILYLLGPDVFAVLPIAYEGAAYAMLAGGLFALHFIVISTGIIALFVMIIEVHARRPVRGFVHVLLALILPTLSFLYFAARFLMTAERNLENM